MFRNNPELGITTSERTKSSILRDVTYLDSPIAHFTSKSEPNNVLSVSWDTTIAPRDGLSLLVQMYLQSRLRYIPPAPTQAYFESLDPSKMRMEPHPVVFDLGGGKDWQVGFGLKPNQTIADLADCLETTVSGLDLPASYKYLFFNSPFWGIGLEGELVPGMAREIRIQSGFKIPKEISQLFAATSDSYLPSRELATFGGLISLYSNNLKSLDQFAA